MCHFVLSGRRRASCAWSRATPCTWRCSPPREGRRAWSRTAPRPSPPHSRRPSRASGRKKGWKSRNVVRFFWVCSISIQYVCPPKPQANFAKFIFADEVGYFSFSRIQNPKSKFFHVFSGENKRCYMYHSSDFNQFPFWGHLFIYRGQGMRENLMQDIFFTNAFLSKA